jgi:peptide/nickel transport system permease protein
MTFKLVILWTDAVLWLTLLAGVGYAVWVRRSPPQAATWRKVWREAVAMSAGVVLAACLAVTMIDSVHFRRALPAGGQEAAGQTFYATRTESLLDLVLARPIAMREASYSSPLAWQGFQKETVVRQGQLLRDFPRLTFGGAHLAQPEQQWLGDVLARAAAGAGLGLAASVAVLLGMTGVWARREPGLRLRSALGRLLRGDSDWPLRAAWVTVSALLLLIGVGVALGSHYHLLGTDRTGNDVVVQALKSIRTAFVIGTLATLATLPFAITLGIAAGYLRGWVDELIQYVYTVLSSVPSVLLIAACVLMVQGFLDQHPDMFETGAERADLKIFLLCVILGVTGWAGLARLLRGETLKLRELEYVQAAVAFGVGRGRIMLRHILPNVMHLVLITTVLSFSDLVLFEAVLSYIGVGVDSSMNSFGGMINLARSEMSRDPLVWWSFSAAFVFMVTLVLAANLFADAVRDAFDPRAAGWRARLRRRAT